MKPKLRLTKGQMAVVITIAMPVLIGAMGLGMDMAVLYYNWVQLQKAADAAALAGAEQLTGDPTTTDNSAVTACAQLYACQDGVSVQTQGTCPGNTEVCAGGTADPMTITPAADERSVTVTVRRTVPYFFFKLIGINDAGVAVRATAGILPTTGVCGAAPFGLPCKLNCNGSAGCYGSGTPGAGDHTCGGAYNFGTQLQFKASNNCVLNGCVITGVPGNWDPLAIGGSGASVYRSNIGYGETQTIRPGDTLPTETGNIVGPTAQGFTDRGLNLTATPVSVPTSFSANDHHIIVVPLVDYTQAKGGKSNVPVVDFVTLYVQALSGNNNTIVATVIPPVAWCGAPVGTTPTTTLGAPFKAILCPDSGCPTLPGSEWPAT